MRKNKEVNWGLKMMKKKRYKEIISEVVVYY